MDFPILAVFALAVLSDFNIRIMIPIDNNSTRDL